jgi:hypothetical protein
LADLLVDWDGEAARVALAQAFVDGDATDLLQQLATRAAPAARLTVLGYLARVPADASSADPLCRAAPMQARIGSGPLQRALLTGQSPTELARRLHLECALLALLLGLCFAAAGLALVG